ncbi:MAG: L-aspartate oxidase [Fibrobacterota bacterium]
MTARRDSYDILIVGGGIAGLVAACESAKKGLSTAVLCTDYPLRSASVCARGGIACGETDEAGRRDHYENTRMAGVGLGDAAAVHDLCYHAEDARRYLQRLGVPFSRDTEHEPARRFFGGHISPKTGQLAARVCHCGDRTGHALLFSLWEEAVHQGVVFLDDQYALRLLSAEDTCYGVRALHLKTGRILDYWAGNTVLATGGYAGIYACSTGSSMQCGDGCRLVADLGIPLRDMEFIQFHPTALYPSGHLITEALRGEGARLINHAGKHFMSEYSPLGDMAGRDIVSRAMYEQMRDENKSHVYLDARHLPRSVFLKCLSALYDMLTRQGGIDPRKERIPVFPAPHYTMGGIPVDSCSRVWDPMQSRCISRLYALGEAACRSTHGANRLGGNSLLETVVFSLLFARDVDAESCRQKRNVFTPSFPKDRPRHTQNTDRENITAHCRTTVSRLLGEYAGGVRHESGLKQGLKTLEKTRRELAALGTYSPRGPYDYREVFRLQACSSALAAEAILRTSLWRRESRGCFLREEYSTPDTVARSSLYYDTPHAAVQGMEVQS